MRKGWQQFSDPPVERVAFLEEHAVDLGTQATLNLPRGGKRTVAKSSITTLSLIEGVPYRTLAHQRLEGMGIRFGDAQLELGTGRIADELRSLGLPKRALMSVWMEHMEARFGPPEKL